MFDSETEDEDEAPSYFTQLVAILACVPTYAQPPRGRPAVTITISRTPFTIEPLTITLKDARHLATKLLVAIATHGDEFAQNLTDANFAVADDGHFVWPTQ